MALYGRRHLLQLIAVKRRQADGRTIAEIQAELTGATDQTLESIARIPERSPEHTAETVSPRTARPRFWAEPSSAPVETGLTPPQKPAPPPKPAPHPAARFPPPAPATETRPPAPPAPPAVLAVIVHGVRLADGVTLLLDGGADGGRAPSPDDLAEITAAAQGLLSLLRERGLTPPEGTHS